MLLMSVSLNERIIYVGAHRRSRIRVMSDLQMFVDGVAFFVKYSMKVRIAVVTLIS